MKPIKVAAGVLNQTPLAWTQNKANILEAIRRARAEDVAILCLPEQAIPGYGCEDAFHAPFVRETSMAMLMEIVPETTGMIVTLGLPVLYRNGLFNAAAMIVDGKLVGFVPKRFLAGDGLHYEPRWFKPWPADERGMVDVGGEDVPIGDIYFDCGGIRIGFEVCEDAWVAERPGAGLARKGVDVLLNPSASHFSFGKLDVRKRFVQEGARAFAVTYIYTNLVGNDSGRVIYDGGGIIASGGDLLAVGERFSFADVGLTVATADVAKTRMIQARTGSYRPDFDVESGECISVPFDYPVVPPVLDEHPELPSWEDADDKKEEVFTRAITLALFDYLRKSRSQGFAISLSGGADSSACAALVALMVQLAARELGLEPVKRRLGHIGAIQDAQDTDAIVGAMLLCVYQATRNSSETTLHAAKTLAAALNARFLCFDVDALVNGYVDMVSAAIERPLTWETDDVTLQNIQARARAPGIWMCANIYNFLLVATSNRSEAAVGYATMDGDTCGGISPIAGIDKAFLRQWLRWLEAEGPEGVGPIAALDVVNAQVPTAELRPQDADQTDEGDLMPYPLLDAIEKVAIRDKRSPIEAYQLMRGAFPQYSARQLGAWVDRFFILWSRNQWKRERYAPSFHVDDENLDPKTWCRFPILSGGFTEELKALRELVSAGN